MSRRTRDTLVADSFLRDVDARAKIVAALAASVAVMLPLPSLAIFCAGFLAFLSAARLGGSLWAQVVRLAPLVGVLFVVDAALVGVEHAILIALRLALVATTFLLLSATTTADEVATALQRVGVSPRVAFTFAAAHRALGSIRDEWHGILDAQRARGIEPLGAADARTRVRQLIAFVVPAVVLVTERAWNLNLAAQVRGLESPHRCGPPPAPLAWRDRLLVAGAIVAPLALGLWS